MSRKILAAGAAICGFTTGGSPSWSLLENTFPWHDQPFATNQNGYTGLDTKLLINGAFGLMHVGALARWHTERIFSYGGREGQSVQFVSGDCAMSMESSGSIGRFKNSLKLNWGTGPLPHWGPPYPKANTILGGATLWVLRGREPADYQGVAQFLKFIVEPRQQIWWAATTGYLPITMTAVKNLEEDAFYKKHPEQPGPAPREFRPGSRGHRARAGEHLRRQEERQGGTRRRGDPGQRDPQAVRRQPRRRRPRRDLTPARAQPQLPSPRLRGQAFVIALFDPCGRPCHICGPLVILATTQ